MNAEEIKVFTGNANPVLAKEICNNLGIQLGQAEVSRFSDGEIRTNIRENVRGGDVYVVQSTSNPANEHLMEMLVMMDALKRASAREINAVLPYYGYARQDRKDESRAPITAKLVADLLHAAGATRVISMDLHADQIQGFFDVPFDHLYAKPVLLEDMRNKFAKINDLVIVSPDAGGVERARSYAKNMKASLAIIDKRRNGPNIAEVMHIIGDVKGKHCVMLDDLIDTAGTICQGADALKREGANKIWAYASHAVLSGPAPERLTSAPLEEIVVTNSISLRPEAMHLKNLRQLSIASLIAKAIERVHQHDSLSTLFA